MSDSEEKSALTGQVSDKRVIILGAELDGMAAAYELGKLASAFFIPTPMANPRN